MAAKLRFCWAEVKSGSGSTTHASPSAARMRFCRAALFPSPNDPTAMTQTAEQTSGPITLAGDSKRFGNVEIAVVHSYVPLTNNSR